MKCDLHIHSTCSDGSLTVEQLIHKAVASGLECISLTDHDTISGTQLMSELGAEAGIKVINGVELSTAIGDMEVHMLVYGFDLSNKKIFDSMSAINNLRDERNRQMVARLSEHGMPIELGNIEQLGSIGRPAIAREMIRLGYVSSVAEAFDLYLGKGKPCYVMSRRYTPREAIEFAKRYNGLAVLAHPKNLRMGYSDFEKFLLSLVKCGLKGIESNYFAHNKSERKFYNKMAKKYRLMATGGSDYHDNSHGIELGSMFFEPNPLTERRLRLIEQSEQ